MSTELQLKQNYMSIEDEIKSFELLKHKADILSRSGIIPETYRGKIPDCLVAIDMANRLNANYLMVMQNLSIIQGRPSWSSQFIIASINNCGKYTSLKFDIKDLGDKEVEHIEYVWNDKIKKKDAITKKVRIHDFSCVAYAIEKSTNERLESATISIEMAVKEGWYNKLGSKWQTMPEIMLRYRSAAFFGRIYAPELLMGLQSVEESQDIAIDLSPKHPDAIDMPQNNLELNTKAPIKFNPKKNKEVEQFESVDITDISDELVENDIPQDILDQAKNLFREEN